MSELLLLEFEGFGADVYERVNGLLGINMDSGEGDWPAGLHTHLAGPTEGGGWIGHRPAETGGMDQAQGTSHAQERFRQGQVSVLAGLLRPVLSRRFGHAAARCYAHALRGAFAHATTITVRAGEWR
jgi:hypothetical protein